MCGTVRRSPTARFHSARGLTLLALATALGGCLATVNVEVDDREDFSTYRTWNWMPQTTPRVKAPPEIAPALEVRLGRLIEAALEERGLRRADSPADFYVTYHLTVERQLESIEQPMAPYFLSSYSSSTSYWIEGTETVERRVDEFRLGIETTQGAGAPTWQAVIERRIEAPGRIPLESAVAELLDRFPANGPAAVPAATN